MLPFLCKSGGPYVKKRFLGQLTVQLHVIPLKVNFNPQKYRTECSQFSLSTLARMEPRIVFGINYYFTAYLLITLRNVNRGENFKVL
jgi:hypothetical protein